VGDKGESESDWRKAPDGFLCADARRRGYFRGMARVTLARNERFQCDDETLARRLPISIAQRHKRRLTIIDKLSREPSMQLARMDDVAGIRLIFQDVPQLQGFRRAFLKSSHNHEKRNHDDKYDYLKTPKNSGYRGVHDVYAISINLRNTSVMQWYHD
jgi:ppGpp synthetase/RelA/SpoT-type nucleotidyltranferase